MRAVNDIVEPIGSTPLVRINKLRPSKTMEIYAKLEGCNPGAPSRIGYAGAWWRKPRELAY